MRQETGSNQISANKKVSIQVKLGGRSFSVENIDVPKNIKQIEFVIDTPRVTLAPRKEVTLDIASDILRLAGKPCHINEQCVCSDLQSEIVAIIAIDKEALDAITKQWGSRATFTSPLLDMRHNEESCITIDTSDEVGYIRLFEKGLQRAKSFEATTAEDILFHVNEWIGNADLPIYIKGSSNASKLLHKYYKQVICE